VMPSTDLSDLVARTGIGSLVCAVKPGDGSAREQAASCQKVLGTWANIANEYATKRYRSNCINWGILPCVTGEDIPGLPMGGYVFIAGARSAVERGAETLDAWLIDGGKSRRLQLKVPDLTELDRKILLAGNLINHQANRA